MDGFLNKLKSGSVITSILCIVIGIIFCVWPKETITTLAKLSGGVLIIIAVVLLIMGILSKEVLGRVGSITPAVICLIFGIWILAKPGFFLTLIPICVGLVMIYHGVKNFIFTVRVKSGNGNKWWVALLIAVVTMGLGVLLIIGAWKAIEIAMILIGIVLIYDGVSGLFLNGKSARSSKKDVIDTDYTEE